jgi:hypothetical protein
MENNESWVAILGAITGVLGTLGWIVHYIVSFISKPRLSFEKGPYVRNWHFVGTPSQRQFVNFEIGVKNKRTALRCIATASITKYPNNITHLENLYSIHWADVPYSGLSTGAEPVDIGGESHRLDVVFTIPGYPGAYIAMPLALSAPTQTPQAYLPPGEYVFKVSVICSNGKGIDKTIRIISPTNWEDLKVENIKVG